MTTPADGAGRHPPSVTPASEPFGFAEQGPPGRAEVEGAIHAVDEMMHVLDGFEQYVIYAAGRDAAGTRYRLNLLWFHAICALLVAPLLSLTGRDGLTGPSFTFLRTLPGSPYSLSTMIGIGGLVLGLGCVFRAKRVEIGGLVLLLLFYLCLAISFAIPGVRWLLEIDASGAPKPPLYGPIIYLHLSSIMAVHIWALLLRHRAEGRARAAGAVGPPSPTGLDGGGGPSWAANI